MDSEGAVTRRSPRLRPDGEGLWDRARNPDGARAHEHVRILVSFLDSSEELFASGDREGARKKVSAFEEEVKRFSEEPFWGQSLLGAISREPESLSTWKDAGVEWRVDGAAPDAPALLGRDEEAGGSWKDPDEIGYGATEPARDALLLRRIRGLTLPGESS